MLSTIKGILILFVVSAFIVSSLGCANKLTRNPVPETYVENVEVFGNPLIRTWGDEFSPEFQQDILDSRAREAPGAYPPKKPGCKKGYSALAVSGGGTSGAFGSGILNGWSNKGDRPEFVLVSGISTGALIAPFAFLGPEYDETLRAGYTGVTTEQIAKSRGVSALWNESISDHTPLVELINSQVDDNVLQAVAREHAKGRRLYLGTFNMDAQRFVIWNMGEIASSGHPKSLELFRQIMIASSSMPVIFPPVFIDVEVNGNYYDEMHVDGGVAAQVFFYGLMLDLAEIEDVEGCTEIFVIRNGKVGHTYEQIERNLGSITKRSVLSMTKSSGRNDLLRIYFLTKEDGIDFYYVAVPDDFKYNAEEPVDQKEMIQMFELGYQMGISDDLWKKQLPGLRK